MQQGIGADPRPLTGEPIALDLLNTRWIDAEGHHDLLHSAEGLAVWLASPSVRTQTGHTPLKADRTTLDALLRTRTVLDTLVLQGQPAPEQAAAELNEVLDHGRIRRLLGPDGSPQSVVEVPEPSWAPAWYAAENWLLLVAERPDRIRPCANDACVLHFYDASKNGTRRWCSMAGCGNRAKAARHYARRGSS
ncbi:CGNR zinc finger domain-containing protein [Streptomyces sp. NPDC002666]